MIEFLLWYGTAVALFGGFLVLPLVDTLLDERRRTGAPTEPSSPTERH